MATRQEFLTLAEQVENICLLVGAMSKESEARTLATKYATNVRELRSQLDEDKRGYLIRWLEGKLKTTVQKSPDGDYLLGTLLGEPIRTDDYLVALVFEWTHESYWSRSWNPGPLKRVQL